MNHKMKLSNSQKYKYRIFNFYVKSVQNFSDDSNVLRQFEGNQREDEELLRRRERTESKREEERRR